MPLKRKQSKNKVFSWSLKGNNPCFIEWAPCTQNCVNALPSLTNNHLCAAHMSEISSYCLINDASLDFFGEVSYISIPYGKDESHGYDSQTWAENKNRNTLPLTHKCWRNGPFSVIVINIFIRLDSFSFSPGWQGSVPSRDQRQSCDQ